MINDYIEAVNTIITNVFNYFNGRVNIFQKARLYINWCSVQGSSNGGLTTNPNCVIIYPRVIERYSNSKEEFTINIILIVIHELYHIDQCIIFNRMEIDKAYHDMIENTVEVESTSYLYNHIHEINEEFNLNIRLNSNKIGYLINFFSDGNLYHRAKYLDHLISLITELFNYQYCVENNILQLITQYYNTSNSKIIIEINNNTLVVKENDAIVNVNILNDFMFDNFYRYNYIAHCEGCVYGENNELTIQLDAKLCNYIAGVK